MIVDCSQSSIFHEIVDVDRLTARHLDWGEYKKMLAINPTTRTHEHFVLFPVSLASRERWRPVELNDRHLRSHGKIGECERSNSIEISYENVIRTIFLVSPFEVV